MEGTDTQVKMTLPNGPHDSELICKKTLRQAFWQQRKLPIFPRVGTSLFEVVFQKTIFWNANMTFLSLIENGF